MLVCGGAETTAGGEDADVLHVMLMGVLGEDEVSS